MDTVCKDCVFAQYKGNTQIGCQFNRLYKFARRGTKVVAAYDNDKEFYVVKSICNFCRNKDWADSQDGDLSEIVQKEAGIKCDVLIYIDNDSSIEQITTTLKSITSQEHGFNKVILVNNSDMVSSQELVNLLKEYDGLLWKIRRILEEEVDLLRCIDIAVKDVKSTFYTVCLSGNVFKPDFLTKLNKRINANLGRFSLISDGNIVGSVVQTHLHNLLGGSRGGHTIVEKIIRLAELENSQHMIKVS